jgi:hypothetical protein
MQWNKTKCAICHSTSSCSEKTKMYINYCGSQRERNHPQMAQALDDCRSQRGLNFINIKTTWKIEELQPALQT